MALLNILISASQFPVCPPRLCFPLYPCSSGVSYGLEGCVLADFIFLLLSGVFSLSFQLVCLSKLQLILNPLNRIPSFLCLSPLSHCNLGGLPGGSWRDAHLPGQVPFPGEFHSFPCLSAFLFLQ